MIDPTTDPPGVERASPENGCPDAAALASFAVGDLEGHAFDPIAEHVAACPTCDAALRELDARGDRLVDDLGRVGDVEESEEEPVPPGLVRVALSGTDRAGTLVVDVGNWIAEALAIGPVRLGKFELSEALGVGSFGHVFKARDTELDRMVALKVQRAGGLSTPEDTERFFREARSAAQLSHPGIVAVYETGQAEDGSCYLVTELIDGETLEERQKRERMGYREAAGLISAVASALHAAHGQGVVHRDVKPSNILIDRDGRPHVADFGLAKRDFGEETVTMEGEVMGTPAYMSPEQARGDSHHVDPRTDVYALGVVLYEMLTGERPFRGNRRMMLLQVLEDEPRAPRRLDEKIPRDLEMICLKGMAKSPDRRFATAQEMADDLGRYLAGEPIHARPTGLLVRAARWCRRYPLAASVFAVVTLSLAAGLLYISSLHTYFVRSAAVRSARDYSLLLEQVNTSYSKIVDGVHARVDATHLYPGKKGVVPLPATYTILLGKQLAETEAGMKVRLYSDHPFPWRKDGGLRDDFERRALAALREDPSKPYHEYVESESGTQLRYATARVMDASCLGCHNHRSDTPKNDWRVGDVRGILEITRPLALDMAEVRGGLRGAFVFAGAVAAALIGLAAGFVLLQNRRRR